MVSVDEDLIIDAVEKVKPSVVSIGSLKLSRSFLFQPLPVKGLGSGFIVRSDGYVVTNSHVIERAGKIEVSMVNGKVLEGRVVGLDKQTDIAIVKVEGEEYPEIKLGNSDNLRVGQIVLAIGNPFGLAGEPTVTLGVISALNRSIQTNRGTYEGLIQTDAAINPGNSGGPLINLKGEVVGINTAVIAYAQGIGFAIPINPAKKVVKDIVTYGRVIRPWLGVYTITVNKALADYYNLPVEKGCLIVEVAPSGPAEELGIRPGDIIYALDSVELKTSSDLRKEIGNRKPGDEIELTIIRGYRKMKLVARLGLI